MTWLNSCRFAGAPWPGPQSLPTEHARQAFSAADPDGVGNIPALEFVQLMMIIRWHCMSPYVQDHLLTVYAAVTVWCVTLYSWQGGWGRSYQTCQLALFQEFQPVLRQPWYQKVVASAIRNTGAASYSKYYGLATAHSRPHLHRPTVIFIRTKESTLVRVHLPL